MVAGGIEVKGGKTIIRLRRCNYYMAGAVKEYAVKVKARKLTGDR